MATTTEESSVLRNFARSYHWWAILSRAALLPIIALSLTWAMQQLSFFLRPPNNFFEYQSIESTGQVVDGFLLMVSTRKIHHEGRYIFNEDLECLFGDRWVTVSYGQRVAVSKATDGRFLRVAWGWPVGNIVPPGATCRTEHLVELTLPPLGIRKIQVIDSHEFMIQPYAQKLAPAQEEE